MSNVSRSSILLLLLLTVAGARTTVAQNTPDLSDAVPPVDEATQPPPGWSLDAAVVEFANRSLLEYAKPPDSYGDGS